MGYAREHEGNLGSQSSIVIPLKLDLTQKFFLNSGLPEGFHKIQDRAMSNAYLRGIDYVFSGGSHWRRNTEKSLCLIGKALQADLSNAFNVLRYILRLVVQVPIAIIRPYLPERLKLALRRLKYRAGTITRDRREGFPSW